MKTFLDSGELFGKLGHFLESEGCLLGFKIKISIRVGLVRLGNILCR